MPPWIHEEVVESRPADPDALLEAAAGRAPPGARVVRILAPDARGRLAPVRAAPVDVPDKGEHFFADAPGESAGGLSGKAIYVSQCHGFVWYDSLDAFDTQRGNVFDTVEDFHNPEGANQFLLRYLENAGARTFAAKERDLNPAWAIVDDGDAGYEEIGGDFADGPAGFALRDTYAYGEDPFDLGTTRTLPADGGGIARWTPEVPYDGWWTVYVAWDSDPGNSRAAHYRIVHPGGTIDRTFDQTVHGSTWQYAETLWLPGGAGGLVVELVGDSGAGTLSADAVRIGGGTTVVTRQGTHPNRPRWEEGAIQAIQFNGGPPSVYDPYGDGTSGDGGSDPSSRSAWAAWEHPAGEDAVYLSWHSNAFDGTARGTITYYAGSECANPAVDGSADLAGLVQDELMATITGGWDADWQDRGVGTSCFSEVSSDINDEMPSILVELAFHDNAEDNAALKEPEFRRDAARAMYRGIVRYFAERDGTPAEFLPEPPAAISLVQADGGLIARWRPGPSGAPLGDPATAYRVWRSDNGLAWGEPVEVSGTELAIDAEPGQAVYVRVTATNPGGESFPSETVGAVRSADGAAPVLVIGAFDRLDQGLLEDVYVDSGSVGWIRRMNLERMNGGRVVVPYVASIAALGWPVDAASDEAGIDLAAYDLVIWAAGEESTEDESFSADQRASIAAFAAAGGAVWTSGSEVLWDLDVADAAFASDVLGASLAADTGSSFVATGEDVLAGLEIAFGGPYPVEYPDALASDLVPVARYADGDVAAVLGERVATFGFPFDAIDDPAVRDAVVAALLPALLPDYVPPEPSDPSDPEDPNVPGGGTSPRARAATGGCGCDAAPGGVPIGVGALLALAVRRRARGHVG